MESTASDFLHNTVYLLHCRSFHICTPPYLCFCVCGYCEHGRATLVQLFALRDPCLHSECTTNMPQWPPSEARVCEYVPVWRGSLLRWSDYHHHHWEFCFLPYNNSENPVTTLLAWQDDIYDTHSWACLPVEKNAKAMQWRRPQFWAPSLWPRQRDEPNHTRRRFMQIRSRNTTHTYYLICLDGLLNERYQIDHKLCHGRFSTMWMAHDLGGW